MFSIIFFFQSMFCLSSNPIMHVDCLVFPAELSQLSGETAPEDKLYKILIRIHKIIKCNLLSSWDSLHNFSGYFLELRRRRLRDSTGHKLCTFQFKRRHFRIIPRGGFSANNESKIKFDVCFTPYYLGRRTCLTFRYLPSHLHQEI